MSFYASLLSIKTCLIMALTLSACAKTPVASEKTASISPVVDANTGEQEIILPEASRPYIEIKAVTLEPEHAIIRAPARVAFRDGAISKVGAPIPGRIMKLHVEAGDKVKIDDPLITIASPEASGLEMELARARIELKSALDAYNRQVDMLEKGVGREYEKIRAEHEVAERRAELQHAQKAVSLLGKNRNGIVIVTAQIEGTVLRRYATLGAQVEPGGDPLLELGNPKALWVVAEVFQDDLPLVKEGSKVSLEFASIPNPVNGKVMAVGVLVDTGIRRAPVYIEVEETPQMLTPGMFARANIQAPAEEGVTVPKTAVLIKDGKTSVCYVENANGTFTRREVILGHSFGEHVQLLGGIKTGERMAIKGALLIDAQAQQLL